MSEAQVPARPTSADPQRTAPTGLLVSAIGNLRQTIPAVLALAFALRDETGFGTLLLGLGAAALLVTFAFAWLAWHRLTYCTGPQDIRVDSGILSRSARSVPYDRIQDVSLEQGPLARLFGLVEVRCETGAGGKDELKLAFLPEAEGERLRELVRDRRDGALPPGAAEVSARETDSEAAPLFAMEPRRVLTFGLFEFSLAVVAVVAGAAQQLDFLLPFDPYDPEAWEPLLAGPGARLSGLGPTAQVVGAILATLSLIVLGFATGVLRTLLRDWNFRLDRTPKGFRRRRGLFTRTDVVMPVHRVQAARVSTRWYRKRFGWYGLKFVSLAQDAGSASHVVAPFAQMEEILPVMAAAGFAPAASDAEWQRGSGRYRADRALVTLAGFGGLALVALATARTVSEVPGWVAIPITLLGILLALRQFFMWRYEIHTLGTKQLHTRRGWLAPHEQIAARMKLQSAQIAQGPLGRLRGYATLNLGLAGGQFALPGLPLAQAHALRRSLVESMVARDFAQLNR